MHSVDESKEKKTNLKRSRSSSLRDMPATDSPATQTPDLCDDVFYIKERVQSPLTGYVAPTSVSFSPDDGTIVYLFSPEQNLSRKVYTFDLNAGKQELFFSPSDGGLDESNISPEEKLRRERSRERGLGIYFQDFSGSEQVLKLRSTSSSPIIDPHLSPDGSMLAYIKDYELHVLNLLYNKQRQLTLVPTGALCPIYEGKRDGRGFVVGGGVRVYSSGANFFNLLPFEKDRKTGYWWSLDGKFIAFTEVDYSEIPLFRIMHQGKSSVGLEAQEDHAYTFAGASNVKVRLGLVSTSGSPVIWMDHICGGPNYDDEYLARLEPPEIVHIQANDGTRLYGALYKPDATRFGPPPYKPCTCGARAFSLEGAGKAWPYRVVRLELWWLSLGHGVGQVPCVFQCAISGAPVTSWDGYDTFYTEKYMGFPSDNAESYEYGSVMHHVNKMKGKLLLVHGMIDENVHFRHTVRLVNAIVVSGKPYELLIFPDERHMPRRHRDRIYMEERI
ncbi:fasciclin-like AGP 15 family protein [Hibiscus syriacus]|uniref:Fasciclin-like AGP 15 family protein n=1 Tax=Hibiscus syriacus TaxID=106335 RepID=A0A6A3C627_HIBSY|nr:fasciclin-like AGP 15 family protein [Hibiscus syriacus]